MIYIVTFHNANNYGAILQNYALQKAIAKLGFNCLTLDYHTDVIEEGYKMWPKISKELEFKKKVSCCLWRILNIAKTRKRNILFSRFRDEKLDLSCSYTSNSIANFIPSEADVLICGSDQVWNVDLVLDEYPIYTLNKFENCYKASYAASIGSTKLTKEMLDAIKKINYITVRENSAKMLLEDKNIDSKVVCDPVFLLSKEEWMGVSSSLIKKRDKTIFTYYLDSEKEIVEIATYLALQTGYKICHPGMRFRKNKKLQSFEYWHGPSEFLSDIINCELSVISSFHGVVFSLIFEKEFFVVLGPKRGERIVDLLSYLGLQDRIINDLGDFKDRFEKIKKIDYKDIKEKIDRLIKKSYRELNIICCADGDVLK